ncbi:MAG TPA: methionyl-tRNA formyltransferase [Smithellaceae bacterium]|mgnify:CR=1 FL=1|nr:methionyl-tRNA formyltransferase [Smithellaceae bacterium]
MDKPKVVFMGTPAFALPALEALHNHAMPVIAVITQPDRPSGRGQKEIAPPVKHLAQKLGLPVLQPQKVKDPEFLDTLGPMEPDLIVVAAFGQILPKTIIDLPSLGCLNIHPSVLPRYRGAAPLNWTLIRGDQLTGVTIMLMDEGMDSGDILMQQETPVGPDETYGELHDRLARLGAELLIQTIDEVVAGRAKRISQDPALVTFAPRLTRETSRIVWNAPASDIVNLIRGLSPAPAAWTRLDGKTLKIYRALFQPAPPDAEPGTVLAANREGIAVAGADAAVLLTDIQLEGKKRMPAADFLRGYPVQEGDRLE